MSQEVKELAKTNAVKWLEDFVNAYNESQDSEMDICDGYDLETIARLHFSYEGTSLILQSAEGGEGEGSYFEYLFKIIDSGTGEVLSYLKKTAHYDSWAGTDWTEGALTQVKPVQRMVTFYE